VQFNLLFTATMNGTGAKIYAGDPDDDTGEGIVKFKLGAWLIGRSGAGATYEFEPSVTALFVLPRSSLRCRLKSRFPV